MIKSTLRSNNSTSKQVKEVTIQDEFESETDSEEARKKQVRHDTQPIDSGIP